MAFHPIMAEDELWDGEMCGHVLAGKKVLLVRLEGRYYAYEDRCAHLGVALSSGRLEGHVLTCNAHHYQYYARTGLGINPRRCVLPRFDVKVEAGQVLVDPAERTDGDDRD
jgi:nitrite reductase/ring-hydroxylating ferredoxin subunit